MRNAACAAFLIYVLGAAMFCQQTKPRAGVAKIPSDDEGLFVTTPISVLAGPAVNDGILKVMKLAARILFICSILISGKLFLVIGFGAITRCGGAVVISTALAIICAIFFFGSIYFA